MAPPAKKDPCQSEACNYQTCLKANNWQESKCEGKFAEILACCRKYREASALCLGMRSSWEEVPKTVGDSHQKAGS
ncbi:hypothetical protein BV898_10191 [Hypsibius exemplaris]|uniref:Cx9C motif-containing protein 4 n=1 Tax=Hypsibius exemplaris TaxID=2072580 RepID=A0A1W0WKA6_HYPEX|nr:hypothetical protein BV898_10191 [Hypsibius exemplaris]